MSFQPARWLPGPHLQTIFGPLLRPWPRPRTERTRWTLPDGDFVDVDALSAPAPRGAPALLVLHGLEGSSSSHYVRGMLAQAERRGLRAFAFNFRSCSGTPNALLRSYHSGETGDLDFAVRRLAAELDGAPLVAVGFSLGGNVLVKWLGEQGDAVPGALRAAAAVSVPFDLAAAARRIDGPGVMAWVYRTKFLRTLRRKALDKALAFPDGLSAERVRGLATLGDFDQHVTAPVHGFAGAEEYWAKSSSGPYVGRVRRPLLLISSADDPMVPAEGLVEIAAQRNLHVTLESFPRGGHVGFVAGPPWAPIFFAEERVAGFFDAHLDRGPGTM